MRSREEEREERRRFEGDVFYEVWRRGGDTDRINYDQLDDCYYDHHEPEVCASRIIQAQRPAPHEDDDYQEGSEVAP